MQAPFFKYQGTGNDFVLIDQRTTHYLTPADTETIARLCDRRFGIGADGLILLQNRAGYDFEMVYFNADGRTSSMCGNGGRCMVAFAKRLEIIEERCHFLAIDGAHEACISGPDWVELKMNDVETVEANPDFFFLDTGSPHYVTFVERLDALNVVQEGRTIRNSERFKAEGTNVNFVEIGSEKVAVATYERGVEDETLSCGTGVTAVALALAAAKNLDGEQTLPIQAKGGALDVKFRKNNGQFEDIWLCSPAEMVFQGMVEL